MFIFKDWQPVKPVHLRKVLSKVLSAINLDHHLYSVHSLRIGRTSDLIKYGYDIETVKRLGRWKSNAVYKYIKL